MNYIENVVEFIQYCIENVAVQNSTTPLLKTDILNFSEKR